MTPRAKRHPLEASDRPMPMGPSFKLSSTMPFCHFIRVQEGPSHAIFRRLTRHLRFEGHMGHPLPEMIASLRMLLVQPVMAPVLAVGVWITHQPLNVTRPLRNSISQMIDSAC